MKPTNMFASLWAVMRKELLDISRDRRTLALALLLGPVLYPTLMLGMGALAENRQKTQLDKVLEVPVVGAEHAPNLVTFLAGHGITATDPPAVRQRSHWCTTARAETPKSRWRACAARWTAMPARSACYG